MKVTRIFSSFVQRACPPDNVTAAAAAATTRQHERALSLPQPTKQRQRRICAATAALKILSLIPRDGILLKQLTHLVIGSHDAESGVSSAISNSNNNNTNEAMMHLPEFLAAISFLRDTDVVIFHRSGSRAHERLVWRLSASQDCQRISLEHVRNTFKSVACELHQDQEQQQQQQQQQLSPLEPVEEGKHPCVVPCNSAFGLPANSDSVNHHHHLHHGYDYDLMEDLLKIQERDIKQERGARLAAEKRAAAAEQEVLQIAHFVARAKFGRRRRQQRSVTHKT